MKNIFLVVTTLTSFALGVGIAYDETSNPSTQIDTSPVQTDPSAMFNVPLVRGRITGVDTATNQFTFATPDRFGTGTVTYIIQLGDSVAVEGVSSVNTGSRSSQLGSALVDKWASIYINETGDSFETKFIGLPPSINL
ncbi:MAG TPA: hypothetical protein VJJ20_03840 [Candidatus Paceibacterota bacterium]